MVSIRDIAEAAGVSVSTVSHVINKSRFVDPEVKRTVLQSIEDLGYQPISLAHAMEPPRSKTIGMLFSSSTNPFFSDVICGVEEGCDRNGYRLILCSCGDTPDRQKIYLDTLRDMAVDALVVMTIKRSEEFQHILEYQDVLPKVVLDSHPFPNACAIGDDSFLGGRLATEYLIARGFNEIGCMTGPPDHPRSNERFRGFEFALRDAGLRVMPEFVIESNLTVQTGYQSIATQLDRRRCFASTMSWRSAPIVR